MNRMLFTAAAVAILAGCASVPTSELAADITPDALLAGTTFGQSYTDSPDVNGDVLALSPEMSAFLDQYVDREADNYRQLHQLIYALIGEGTFGLEYGESTHTAAETFRRRHGNCLSFTNMFVALARDVGLEVSYQEVDIPPDWSVSDNTYLLNRHVNVYVDLGFAGEHVVDFNIGDFRTSYDRRIISDERGLAHFHNNKGVEHIHDGDTDAALANLQRALELDRGFAPAWTNLGALYRRQGLAAHAEASFLQALAVNSAEYAAMSNLASLYADRGDTERAEYFEKRATRHRMRNPYYRFGLARQAFLARDYDEAIDHARYALRKKPNEDSFYFLMGLSYLQLGEEDKARRMLEKAENVAQNDALKRNYRTKMDLLLSGTPDD